MMRMVTIAVVLTGVFASTLTGQQNTIRQPAASSLALAASLGDMEAVTELLEEGTPVDESDSARRTPLALASRWGRTELVELFIKEGADVNAADLEGKSPMHWAVVAGPASLADPIVAILLKAGATVDARDGCGRTPLHYAVMRASPQIIELAKALVAAGAQVDARDEDGATPRSLAAKLDRAALVSLFEEIGEVSPR